MCGIYAAIGEAEAEAAARALRVLQERGPDGSALLVEDACALGLARLAIVAPAAPACVQVSGPIAGVINGELYEHRALRARLEVEAGGSDQAVAVALFARGGAEELRAARGPVTGAFVDRERHTLTLVRDRFGKRPLFVDRRSPERACRAASEIKALLAAHPAPLRFSRAAVARFLARGIVEDALPLVEGIEAVPPGAVLRADARGRLEALARASQPPAHAPALDLELVRRACARRLEGLEVDAALLLSGGLDSSVVAALTRGRHLPAYTMHLRDGGHGPRDEVTKARAVAELFGLEHRVVDVPPPGFAELAACAWRLEAPDAFIGFGLAHAYRTLARRLRDDGVRVVLTGEGADELFLGYAWQRAQAAAQQGWRFPADLVDERAYCAASLASARECRALEVFLRAQFGELLGGREPLALCRAEALAEPTEQLPAGERRVAGGAERRRAESLAIDLPMWPLRVADRLLLGGGVEPRAPFLDDEVVDAALALPASTFEAEGADKPTLRALAAPLLPGPLPPKQGFGAWSWPGATTTRAWARRLADEGTLLVRGEALRELAAGDDDAGALVAWRLVVLEVAARQLDAARQGSPWRP